MDCYRLNSAEDAETVGIDDLLRGLGPVIFEWPERIASILPPDRLWVDLRVTEPTRRNLVFRAFGPRPLSLLNVFRGTGTG
jgi:tRNA A37 threonylcarbamoyladenosine biosynthesis protein TsaE